MCGDTHGARSAPTGSARASGESRSPVPTPSWRGASRSRSERPVRGRPEDEPVASPRGDAVLDESAAEHGCDRDVAAARPGLRFEIHAGLWVLRSPNADDSFDEVDVLPAQSEQLA